MGSIQDYSTTSSLLAFHAFSILFITSMENSMIIIQNWKKAICSLIQLLVMVMLLKKSPASEKPRRLAIQAVTNTHTYLTNHSIVGVLT